MIIYKATNLVNGKVYIGQTVGTLGSRRAKHIWCANNDRSCYFPRALNKYGINNFKWSVVYRTDNIDNLNRMEQYMIAFYNSMSNGNGYNINSGGNNFIMSDEQKEDISQRMIEQWKNSEYRTEISKSISKGSLGKKLTQEHKDNIRENSPKYWLGKKLYKSTCEKLSGAHRGVKLSKKHCRGISSALEKRWEDPKFKQNFSDLMKKKWADPNWRKMMLKAQAKSKNLKETRSK